MEINETPLDPPLLRLLLCPLIITCCVLLIGKEILYPAKSGSPNTIIREYVYNINGGEAL